MLYEHPARPCVALTQVFNEDRKQINGLLLVHLPDGPTARFRLSNLVLSDDIKVGAQHGTARHSTAQHSTAQHSMAQSWEMGVYNLVLETT